jgi:glycosyltransferase involved in cell wall biosynthesis
MSHKRVDLAVSACKRLGRRLVVVGDGPELAPLQQLAGGAATFLGRVSNRELAGLYAGCRALLFCSHEDYGLSPIEAQASGRPVIAFGAGGVRETVLEGETGVFFRTQDVDAVVEAIVAFERMTFEPTAIRRAAARFDHTRFIDELRDFVGVREAATTRVCNQSQSGESTDPALARTGRGIE